MEQSWTEGYSSIPASQVGDHQRSPVLDRRQSQPEVERRPTLQEIGEACVTVERLPNSEAGSGQSHSSATDDSGNIV